MLCSSTNSTVSNHASNIDLNLLIKYICVCLLIIIINRTLKLNHNVTIQSVSNVKLLGVNIEVEFNFNHHIALLCNKAGRQINALSRLSNVLNVDTKILIL